jgi:ADP-ribose pyrophosphatase
MGEPGDAETLGQGRFLRLVRRNHWEFVERTRPVRSVFIAAVTDDGRLLLTVEHRVPVSADVIGFPAGLVGDSDEDAEESLEVATRRELIEEAGYEPRSVEFLSRGPTSPGMTDEVIALMLATGLHRVGAGGGVGGESITVHEVPLAEVDGWLNARVARGALVDPKVYSGLYFLDRRGMVPHHS